VKTIKVSDNIHDKLLELAQKRSISINQLVEEILNVYIMVLVVKNQLRRYLKKTWSYTIMVNVRSAVNN
jgi:hypothetical protein